MIARESNSAINSSKEATIAEKEYLQEIRRLRQRLQSAMKCGSKELARAAAGAARVENAFLSSASIPLSGGDDGYEPSSAEAASMVLNRVKVLEDKNKKNEQKLELKDKKIKELVVEIQAEQDANRTFAKDLQEARDAASAANKEVLGLKMTLSSMKQEMKRLKQTVALERERQQKMDEERAAHEKEKEQKTKDYENMADERENELDTSQQKVAQLQHKLQLAEKALEEKAEWHRKEVATLTAEVRAERSRGHDKPESLVQQLELLKAEVKDLKAKREKEKSSALELTTLQELVLDLKFALQMTSHHELLHDLESVHAERVSHGGDTLQKRASTLEKLEIQIKTMEAEIESKAAALIETRGELTSCNRRLRTALEKISRLEEGGLEKVKGNQVNDDNSEVAKARVKCEEMRETMQKLEQELFSLTTRTNKMEKEKLESNALVKDLNQKLDKFKATNCDLCDQVKGLETATKKLRNE